jgi:hypothetical protein
MEKDIIKIEKKLDEVCKRADNIEKIVYRLEALMPEKALIESLQNENILLRVSALETVVSNHRQDCEKFRARAYTIIQFILIAVVSAVLGLILI